MAEFDGFLYFGIAEIRGFGTKAEKLSADINRIGAEAYGCFQNGKTPGREQKFRFVHESNPFPGVTGQQSLSDNLEMHIPSPSGNMTESKSPERNSMSANSRILR